MIWHLNAELRYFPNIDLMQKVRDSQSSQQIELKETHAVSPDSMAHEDGLSEVLPSQSAWKCYWKRCMFLAMLVICSAMLGIEINAQKGADVIVNHQSSISSDDFNFLVFCPYSYYSKEASFKEKKDPKDELRRRLLYQTYSYNINVNIKDKANFDANRTYVVEAQSHNFTYFNSTSRKNESRIQLFYCGLVRDFYMTCQDSYMACSSPGPMFDIPTRDSVDIIWVNKLDPQLRPNVGDSCMNKTLYPHGSPFCSIMAKINRTQTYIDPTGLMDLSTPLKHMEITEQSWPMTTHLHGAEIRPTFDGNPLSWIDNRPYSDGQVGVATFSLDEDCYYNSFDKISDSNNYNPPRINLIGEVGKSNYKINRYPNRQNPGNLWYHDHAMHLTDFNVRYGLAGFYILRDEKVQAEIGVDRSNEKLVMVTGLEFTQLTPSFPLSGFVPGEVYRFRFLNNNFDDGDLSMIRISYSYNNCMDKLEQRQPFTIIGADSSLFSQSIDNQKSFIITQAERMEILIIFQNKTSFSICANEFNESISHIGKQANRTVKSQGSHGKRNKPAVSANSYSIKGIGLKKRDASFVSLNKRTSITNITLSVPFTDLSKKTKIAITRMRPLIWVGAETFTINGRLDFHKGWSENPTLGTIEDWILINTIFFPHPIHVHLINFQVIREYNLTTFTTQGGNTCSLYEMDFYVEVLKKKAKQISKKDSDYENMTKLIGIVFNNSVINYTYLCDNVYDIGLLPSVQDGLNTIYPENKVDSDRVSGHDLFKKITRAERPNLQKLKFSKPINFSDTESYKYIVDDGHPSDKPYYARWKDTAFVEKFKALHYRIRWTKSEYTLEDEKKGTYFNVPNDQVREFPGFVYHCHILRHEDDEMMRPIMMQLPPGAQLNTSTPCNSYNTGEPILKWSDKYNCINKGCNNTKTIK